MSGVDHRAPGVAVAALLDDAAYVELIADKIHVHPALWPLITRLKPPDRLLLVRDAVAPAGRGDGRGGGRGPPGGGGGVGAPAAPRPPPGPPPSRNPLAMLGISDRGRIAAGQRADLVELDPELRVRRVMRAGTWFAAGPPRRGRGPPR